MVFSHLNERPDACWKELVRQARDLDFGGAANKFDFAGHLQSCGAYVCGAVARKLRTNDPVVVASGPELFGASVADELDKLSGGLLDGLFSGKVLELLLQLALARMEDPDVLDKLVDWIVGMVR